MYIVLGVLYESYIHPITILSTLPSAGIGALLALLVSGNDLGIIAIIGIILLIGIVKKNAIMMIDFALEAEREHGRTPHEAIREAALLRFRPILMTTMAALLGALPLMLGGGVGSELRHPLGVTMVGGLLVSQVLTLFTTPVVYLYFDRLALRVRRRAAARFGRHERRRADRRGDAAGGPGMTTPCRRMAGSPRTPPRSFRSIPPGNVKPGGPPMSLSGPFIDRPVATTLLTLGLALAGLMAFFQLPVSPLPQVDYPTISVQASLPGASPETMAATVATPLERALGRIAGVTEMTSSSSLGSTRITLQFELDRDIDGAARDVQAAINASRNTLPTGLPSNPTYRKVNPADAPIMLIALTSDTLTRAQIYDAASTVLAQKLSQVSGIGQVSVGGLVAAGGARRGEPAAAQQVRDRDGGRAHRDRRDQRQPAERRARGRRPALADRRQRPGVQGGRIRADHRRVAQRRAGARGRRRRGGRFGAGPAQRRLGRRQAIRAAHPEPAAGRQHHRDGRSRARRAAAAAGVDSVGDRPQGGAGPHADDPRVAARGGARARHLVRPRDRHRVRVPAQRARGADPDAWPCPSR